MPPRRHLGRREWLGLAAGAAIAGPVLGAAGPSRRPNVLLVLTDDQGWGDLGCHGNPVLPTPHTNRLRREGVELTRFYVCPVCSPTRACLMTGRYNQCTGAIDTYLGRSMMWADEVTIAERFAAVGYRTGIFGKWHLGDNYPMRPTDQGFGEALVHQGGGIGQPADPPDTGYFNPILQHNGRAERHQGYCTDIFTDAAAGFIAADPDRPFFAYLATNAPHAPLDVADRYVQPFLDRGVPEREAKVYGMVANLDENLGRLLARLDRLGQAEDTIVVFLTDNGPQWPRFNGGLRGTKGSVYEGGIRVPCFLRWPGHLPAGSAVDRIAAHIDLAPTLLAACGIAAEPPAMDGRSLLPLLRGEARQWPDRRLFFQWHRGDAPVPFKNCAVRTQQYKLVDGKELFDLEADEGEQTDVAAAHPELVGELRGDYEHWLADVSATRGYDPPPIPLSTPFGDPVTLTRQDWRGAAGWGPKDVGWWHVEVTRPAAYRVGLRFARAPADGVALLRLGGVAAEVAVAKGAVECLFEGVRPATGPTRLVAALECGGQRLGAQYVDVTCAPEQ